MQFTELVLKVLLFLATCPDNDSLLCTVYPRNMSFILKTYTQCREHI